MISDQTVRIDSIFITDKSKFHITFLSHFYFLRCVDSIRNIFWKNECRRIDSIHREIRSQVRSLLIDLKLVYSSIQNSDIFFQAFFVKGLVFVVSDKSWIFDAIFCRNPVSSHFLFHLQYQLKPVQISRTCVVCRSLGLALAVLEFRAALSDQRYGMDRASHFPRRDFGRDNDGHPVRLWSC